MKPLLLTLSLAANGVLVAGLVYLVLHPGDRTPVGAGEPAGPAASSLVAPRPAAAAESSSVTQDAFWRSPADVQAWLLSNHVPLELRHAIAQAMLEVKYKASREAAHFPRGLKRWQSRQFTHENTDHEFVLHRQQEEEMKQLLGADLAKARYGEDTVAKSGLSPEAWLEINRVTGDYAEARTKLLRTGPMTREAERLMNEEMNADLAATLPPAEFETYRAFHTPDGSRLQRALAGLDIDDETYLRAFRAMTGVKTPDTPAVPGVPIRPEEIRAIESAMGPEVARHIIMTQDQPFREVSALYARVIPAENLLDRYEAWAQFQQTLRNGGSINPENMDASRRTLLRSYYDRLTAGLSAEARAEFDRTRAGRIMNTVVKEKQAP